MNPSIALASLIALIFTVLGMAKILALAPMRELAAHAGFSTAAYRRIGALEVAGAVGVALGPDVPLLGGLAGAGLLALLAGALITHVRNHDEPRAIAPAAVCAVLVAGYLAVLFGATP
jgi:hypothetical protein